MQAKGLVALPNQVSSKTATGALESLGDIGFVVCDVALCSSQRAVLASLLLSTHSVQIQFPLQYR